MNLDRERIVDAGLEVLRDQGLAALNMRAIAGELGVRASALYRYFPSKEALLGEMSQRLFAEAQSHLAEDLDWSRWLIEFGRGLRANLLRYRDSAVMCTAAPPPSSDVQSTALAITSPSLERGIPGDEALADMGCVIAFTVGLTAYQQSDAYTEFLDQMLGFDHTFERGLNALVCGLTTVSPGTQARDQGSGHLA